MNVLRPIQKEYYGDDVRWFLGYVVNATPPAGLEGRVKVRILGVHSEKTDDIPEKDLPWAQVIVPTTEGGSSGIGRIPQMTTGAFVFGVFLDGIASQIPLVLGSLPRIELPTTVQSGRRLNSIDKFVYDQNRIQNVVITRLYDDDVPNADVNLRRQQAMKFFIDNGYNLIHSAALAGALQGASSFVTFNSKPKTGIAKWSVDGKIGSRYAGLLQFAVSYVPATDWKLFSVQLQYVLFELRNKFGSANNALLATQNLTDASEVVNRLYLKIPQNTKRLAERAYEEVMT
jgi:hypothetical protein